MKNITLIFCILLFVSIKTVSASDVRIDQTYYVSSSEGSDVNDGHTPDRPLKTLNCPKIRKENSRIYLKRGDVFYENITEIYSCIIDSYGIGDRPIICGFRKLKKTGEWVNIRNNIWQLDMFDTANFSGYPFSRENDNRLEPLNNIGFIYDEGSGELHGHLVSSLSKLEKRWDIFTSEIHQTNELQPETYRYVYLYHENPNNLTELCFPVFRRGVFYAENCSIRNITIRGFGWHGFHAARNTVLEKCVIDMIGGAVQVGLPFWVRFGNGVEFWIDESGFCTNNLIQDCWISRTYDCGATIQGQGENMTNVVSIKFLNNTFYHCRQAFEHFLKPTDLSDPKYIDCEFSNNICLEMGVNEFETPEIRDANILSYESKNCLVKIQNNLFFGSNHYCGERWSENMSNNIIYIYEDQYLNNYHGSYNYPVIYARNESDIQAYRDRFGDWSSEIYLMKRNNRFIEDLFAILSSRDINTLPENVSIDQGNISRSAFFARNSIVCSLNAGSAEKTLIAGRSIHFNPGFAIKSTGNSTFVAIVNPLLTYDYPATPWNGSSDATLRNSTETTNIYTCRENEISVFFNSESDRIEFSGIKSKISLTVSNIAGVQIIYNESDKDFSIDSSGLNFGVYILTVTDSETNRSFSVKIIKK